MRNEARRCSLNQLYVGCGALDLPHARTLLYDAREVVGTVDEPWTVVVGDVSSAAPRAGTGLGDWGATLSIISACPDVPPVCEHTEFFTVSYTFFSTRRQRLP